MPKFKDIDFDRTEVILLSDGSYLLVACDHTEQKQAFKTVENLFKQIEKNGTKCPSILLGYHVSRRDFKFLANTIEKDVDEMHLDYNSIVLYDADRYCKDEA